MENQIEEIQDLGKVKEVETVVNAEIGEASRFEAEVVEEIQLQVELRERLI